MTSLKSFLVILLGLGWTLAGSAQEPAVIDANGMVANAPRTAEELDSLFAPIALYPDALVALMLPAATSPADISRAAGFLSANGDMSQLDNQPWDESVKSLAHYPDVLRWMDANTAWTQAAGDAFLAQPADVMNSVQRLRSRAVAAGGLVDTPQQDVVTTGTEIRIIPAQPDVIYVPYYSPDIFYSNRRSPGWRMSFGPPLRVGAWLNFDLDWDRRGIWAGEWHPGSDFRHPAWHNTAAFPGRPWTPPVGHLWTPPPTRHSTRQIVLNRAPQQDIRQAPTQALQPPPPRPQTRPASPAPRSTAPAPRSTGPAPRPAVPASAQPQPQTRRFSLRPAPPAPPPVPPAANPAPQGRGTEAPPSNRGARPSPQSSPDSTTDTSTTPAPFSIRRPHPQ